MTEATGRSAVERTALARLDGLLREIDEAAGLPDERAWQAMRVLRARVATAIAAIAGANSDYYLAVPEVDQAFTSAAAFAHLRGLLVSLRADVEAGYFQRVEDLVSAEVFGDFLDMAEHLIGAGYVVPAASLIGAVLEDGLKRLAALQSGMTARAGEGIGAVNHRLADANVYSNLVRKQVEVWAAVRNGADHGQFDEVTPANVQDMYAGVTRFLHDQAG